MSRAAKAVDSGFGVGTEKTGVMARSEMTRVIGKYMMDGKAERQ
jgi:hypothetical protein